MTDVIVVLILVVIVGLATAYIIKEKKRGVKCIGCPAGGNCSNGMCSGNCHMAEHECTCHSDTGEKE